MPPRPDAEADQAASNWRETLGGWVEGVRVTRFIITLIIINAVILGLETSPAIMERAGDLLLAANAVILGIFVVEIGLKLVAFGPRFFRSGWNLFDFFVVGISLVPAAGPFEILRALRVLRVLRLLSQVPRLRAIIESIMRSLPGIGWTALLLVLVFYVFAVMGTMLFRDSFPEYWGSLGASLFSLFQIMTLESWSSGIARPMLEVYPWVWVYFVPFILISSFMVLNLFIAIIVTATQSIHADEEELGRQELLRELRAINQRLERLESSKP